MPSYTYCPSCGSKIEYALSKPDKCPKCGKTFAAAYSKPSVASVPVVASTPAPVTSPSDASLLASLPPEIQALVVQAIAQKLAGGGVPARQVQPRTVQPQRGTAAMRKQMAIRRAAASANAGGDDDTDLAGDGSDDDGDYSAEDEYYNEAEAHALANQMMSQIDMSKIIVSVPTSNPNIQRFGDVCNGQQG